MGDKAFHGGGAQDACMDTAGRTTGTLGRASSVSGSAARRRHRTQVSEIPSRAEAEPCHALGDSP